MKVLSNACSIRFSCATFFVTILVSGLVSIVISRPVWAAQEQRSIEQILNDAKKALNGGTVQPGAGGTATADDATEEPRKPTRHSKSARQNNESGSSKNSGPKTKSQNSPIVTDPLPEDQAQSILQMDLKSIARERQPRDPQFVAYLAMGQMIAHPSVHLTKDDDQFVLHGNSALAGGELQLKTSWEITQFADDRFVLRFIGLGSGGMFSSDATVDRTGIQNETRGFTYRVAPFALAVGPELDFNHRFRLGLTLGPTLDLVSIAGGGQSDTLTQVFTGDRMQISLGVGFLQNWEANVSVFQNGILNHNITDSGVLIALGYVISG